MTRTTSRKHVLAAPLLERFVEALREPVVDHRREVLLVDAVVLVGGQQFVGADQPERVEQLRADRVVAALAAIERQQRHARAVAAAQLRQDAAVLVIRMRRDVHHAGRGLEFLDLLPCAGRAGVLGDRLRRQRGERGTDDEVAVSVRRRMADSLVRSAVEC